MTTYYIDFDGGSDAADGLSTGNAWLTCNKYTDRSLTPGDIGIIRAGTTEVVTTDLECDTDGTPTAPIQLIGADDGSVYGDPWGDASNVSPILDFNATQWRFQNGKDWWIFKNIHSINSHENSGMWYFLARQGNNCTWIGCTFEDAFRRAVFFDNITNPRFIDCAFPNNGDAGSTYQEIYLGQCSGAYFLRCSFDPHPSGFVAAIRLDGGDMTLEECNFSVDDERSIQVTAGICHLRNCSVPTTEVATLMDIYDCRLYSDGYDFDTPALQKGRQWQFQYGGEFDSSSTYARSGGAAQGWRWQSNSDCGLNTPLQMTYYAHVANASSVDYILYAQFQAGDAFAGDLDESELYFTVTELKDDGTNVVSEPASITWDFDDTSTWQSMTIAHQADAAGTLRIDVYLKAPSGTVHIDIPNKAAMVYADGEPLWGVLPLESSGGDETTQMISLGTLGSFPDYPLKADVTAGVNFANDALTGEAEAGGGGAGQLVNGGLVD